MAIVGLTGKGTWITAQTEWLKKSIQLEGEPCMAKSQSHRENRAMKGTARMKAHGVNEQLCLLTRDKAACPPAAIWKRERG